MLAHSNVLTVAVVSLALLCVRIIVTRSCYLLKCILYLSIVTMVEAIK